METTKINGTQLQPPPHNPDAELGLLGSVLYLNEAIEQVDFQPEYFYGVENKIVAQTIATMWKSGCRALDHITLGDELQRTGRLESAGGVQYLITLIESVPHAEHARYYANIVQENYQRRQIIRQCELLSSEARRPDTNIGHLVEHLTSMLKDSRLGTGKHRLPDFHDAWQAADKPRPMRECIIEGLLRRGEVGNIIAATKTGKSWFALQLLMSVAMGRDWLGRRVAGGNVLLIDNELHEETIENRLSDVQFAMKIDPKAERARFEYVACRGNWISIQDLIEVLPERYPPGTLNLITIDAKYRLFGNGLEENSNDDQTTFHNLIDQFAKEMNCPILLVHHATKGDQSGKAVTDVGSGGGSQSRAVDLHMTIRPHEQPGFAVMEAALRSFKPVKAVALGWKWPLWSVATDVEPVLKADKTKGDSRRESKDAAGIDDLKKILSASKEPLSRNAMHKAFGGGKERLNRLIRVALEKGSIELVGTKESQNGIVAELFTIADRKATNVQQSDSTV